MWNCSDGGDEGVGENEGKGAYALFLKKKIEVSAGESRTDVVIEWAKTSWEITLGQGDIVKSVTPTSGGNNTGEKQYTKVRVSCNANSTMKQRTQTIRLSLVGSEMCIRDSISAGCRIWRDVQSEDLVWRQSPFCTAIR